MSENGLLTRTYSARDQVPDFPDFTRVKNKLPFWDKNIFMLRHNIYIYIYIYKEQYCQYENRYKVDPIIK